MAHTAVITKDTTDPAYPDGVWLVEFPDLHGCQTFGETLAEARTHALEAAQVWLDVDDVDIVFG